MKRYVVITGASSGIGRALTLCFAKLGYDIIAIGRNEMALYATHLLANKSNKINLVVADFKVTTALDKIVSLFKPDDKIAYLIHCAATTEPHVPLTRVPFHEFKETMKVNLLTPLFLTQKLTPYFDATYTSMTRVLFMGSDYVGTNKVRPTIMGSYSVSKSALQTAVEYFRQESKGALISYLNPGATDTEMFYTVKTAVLNQNGIFTPPAQIASPIDVAEFIRAVLKETSNEVYTATNWDYRNKEHCAQVLKEVENKSALPKEIENEPAPLTTNVPCNL